MTEKDTNQPLICPSCKKEITIIQIQNVVASCALVFHKKEGKYVQRWDLLDFEDFECSHCGEPIGFDLIKPHLHEHLIALKVSGDKKAFIVDQQDLPFDIAYAEFAEELEKAFQLRGKEEVNENGN